MRRILIGVLAVLSVAALASAQITPIADIQTVTDPATSDASPMLGQTVTVDAWVTFEPMSFGGHQFFVADAAGPWNGIYVYAGGLSDNYGFGWHLQITGTVAEYDHSGDWANSITELDVADPANDIVVVDDTVDWANLPAACAYTVTPASDFGDISTSEQWESVLVELDDVTTENADAGFGEWTVQDASSNIVKIDNPSDAVYGYKHHVMADQPYEYVRGVVNYSYDEFKVLPEIGFNLKVAEDPASGWYTQFAYFQQVRPMDMAIQYDSTGAPYTHDQSYCSQTRDGSGTGGDTVTVHAVVTMPTGLSYAGAGVKFNMSDWNDGDTEEPWGGIMCYSPDSTTFPTLEIGDEVEVTGYVSEYVTNPAHMTEMWITQPIQVLDVGTPAPIPADVSVADMRDPQIAEMWGTQFVKLHSVVVMDNELTYGMFNVDDNVSDDVLPFVVDDDSDSLTTYQYPAVGANIDSVYGWIYHHYGNLLDDDGTNWTYQMEPLYAEDIVIGEAPPNILSVSRDHGTVDPDQDVLVSADIADNIEVASATLYYKIGFEGDLQSVAMTHGDGLTWSGTIPGQAEGTYVWYYVEGEDNLNQTTTAPSNLENNMYGYMATSTMNIYKVQYTPFPSGTSPYNGALVTVQGVITIPQANADAYADATYGPAYMMQTGTDPAYSGICVHLTSDLGTFNVGDQVTVTGTVDETGLGNDYKWGGNTRILNVVNVRTGSTGQPFEYYPVTAADVNADLESYESVMVEFTNLTITSLNQYDWSFTDDSGETFLLDDDYVPSSDSTMQNWYDGLEEGTTISTLHGVITYSYGSWKVEPRNANDVSTLSAPEGPVAAQPYEFSLSPVYPNPFNPTTNIHFTLAHNSNVKLIVYNALGQKVRTLINAPMTMGNHSAYWNGRNDAGQSVTSGAYFLRLWTKDHQQVQKMVLMK